MMLLAIWLPLVNSVVVQTYQLQPNQAYGTVARRDQRDQRHWRITSMALAHWPRSQILTDVKSFQNIFTTKTFIIFRRDHLKFDKIFIYQHHAMINLIPRFFDYHNFVDLMRISGICFDATVIDFWKCTRWRCKMFKMFKIVLLTSVNWIPKTQQHYSTAS